MILTIKYLALHLRQGVLQMQQMLQWKAKAAGLLSEAMKLIFCEAYMEFFLSCEKSDYHIGDSPFYKPGV